MPHLNAVERGVLAAIRDRYRRLKDAVTDETFV